MHGHLLTRHPSQLHVLRGVADFYTYVLVGYRRGADHQSVRNGEKGTLSFMEPPNGPLSKRKASGNHAPRLLATHRATSRVF